MAIHLVTINSNITLPSKITILSIITILLPCNFFQILWRKMILKKHKFGLKFTPYPPPLFAPRLVYVFNALGVEYDTLNEKKNV